MKHWRHTPRHVIGGEWIRAGEVEDTGASTEGQIGLHTMGLNNHHSRGEDSAPLIIYETGRLTQTLTAHFEFARTGGNTEIAAAGPVHIFHAA